MKPVDIPFLLLILLCMIQLSHQTNYSCNASAPCGCSMNSAIVTRIVGGENTAVATWGWAVSLLVGGSYLCGGSIVSNLWIITAAHCVSGFRASQISVYAGSVFRFTGTQSSVGSHVIVHPNYNPSTFVNDIAMIRLDSPFSMSDPFISTICLPTINASILTTTEWPPVNTSVVAVGYGRLNESGLLASRLQQVTVFTMAYNSAMCSPSMVNRQIQLCAAEYGGGKDTCQGDSGGPLMMFNSNNQWVLIGITSSGIGCARATNAGLYTRVAAYQSWINATMSATYSHQVSTYEFSIVSLSLSLISFVLQTYI